MITNESLAEGIYLYTFLNASNDRVFGKLVIIG